MSTLAPWRTEASNEMRQSKDEGEFGHLDRSSEASHSSIGKAIEMKIRRTSGMRLSNLYCGGTNAELAIPVRKRGGSVLPP